MAISNIRSWGNARRALPRRCPGIRCRMCRSQRRDVPWCVWGMSGTGCSIASSLLEKKCTTRLQSLVVPAWMRFEMNKNFREIHVLI